MVQFLSQFDQLMFYIVLQLIIDELSEMIEEYCNLGFPFTSREVRDITFEYAMDHDLKGFSENLCAAGPHWFQYFLARHRKLSIKHATNLSIYRAMSPNKVILNHWFDEYEEVIKQLKIDDPCYLWNVDEHGTEDVLKCSKVVGIKGIRAKQTVCREKSCRSTMLTYVNAAGYALPPMVIHRGKFHDNWHKNAPSRVLVHSSKKGTSINNFSQNMERCFFIIYLLRNIDKPNLVVMDSHYSHTFNYLYMKVMFECDVKLWG